MWIFLRAKSKQNLALFPACILLILQLYDSSFIVTYAAPPERMHWGEDEDCIRIWDVRTGEMKKGFSLYALTSRNELSTWPIFKWSHDEKFFACLKAPGRDKLEKETRVSFSFYVAHWTL